MKRVTNEDVIRAFANGWGASAGNLQSIRHGPERVELRSYNVTIAWRWAGEDGEPTFTVFSFRKPNGLSVTTSKHVGSCLAHLTRWYPDEFEVWTPTKAEMAHARKGVQKFKVVTALAK